MGGPRWRVYYADGETVDSETPVEQVPARGVLVAVHPDPDVGRVITAGHDFYTWRPDRERWIGVADNFGLWDYLAAPGMKRVLFGRTVSRERYAEIYHRAVDDPDFPRKSAWDPSNEQERERPTGVDL